ncbi:golgin subfamily A member 2 [Anopheles ziemanni]|uniref:golgin subfamily A member 2 n=1 Tax=Anopheles coustani TaxID=139045 RepID=UPI00265916E6|nr:golgin subfamily A member 2 [Anopheles coustani]XP_058173786.1 golgin subfamily A member 2 [Anopheles ziemanni]
MADKAEKIAAARKKLKQYQARHKDREHEGNHTAELFSESYTPDVTGPVDTTSQSLSPPPSSECSATVEQTSAPAQPTVNSNSVIEPSTARHDDFNSNYFSSAIFDTQKPQTDGRSIVSISNYFANESNPFSDTRFPAGGSDFFGHIEPQPAPSEPPVPIAQPVLEPRHVEPPVDVNVFNINKISEEIGNLIANANADLGPQNTILELESEKADLGRQLNAEKLENDELRLRLRNHQSLVDELKIEIEKLRLENKTRVTVELGPLQEQLQMQIQAVGVLVGEKAELTASLAKSQSLVMERAAENEDLQDRLKETNALVQKLEHELADSKSHGQRYEQLEQTITSQVGEYQREADRFRKLYEDLQEDLAELRQKLTVRNEEYQTVQQALEQTRSELGLARVRIDQLTTDDGQDYNAKIESLTQQTLIKAQQIKDLQEVVKQIGAERDQSNQQYQNYVLHLNKEIGNLAEKIQELTDENNRLAKSEESAVRFANELERQIQQQMLKQQTVQQEATGTPITGTATREEQENTKRELEALQKRCTELEHENEYLKTQDASQQKEQETDFEAKLNQYEEQIATLQLTVDRLQLDKPDVAKLLAEIESGKVGASRAVTQNQELKSQLEEMQRAFVQISNDKLNLTDKLQTELHLGKEMKANYGNLEAELAAIREKLHYKDEEMIRLAHENTELNKQIYQQNQEIDRLRYYESRSNDASTLQRELESHKRTVEDLQRQLRTVADEQKVTVNGEISEPAACETSNHLQHEIETLRQEKEELLKALNRFQQDRTTTNGPEPNAFDRQSSIVSSIPTMEAMEKLQQRFKRTMLEVAELTEEKQRLEHLVLQLQGETETIGEYITLYQQQRRLLKQKDMERDLQLQQLADDREMMKLKLKELNYLVHRLVLEQGGGTDELRSPAGSAHMVHSPEGHPFAGNPSPAGGTPSPNGPLDGTTASQQHTNGDDCHHSPLLPKVQIKANETAGRILSLLTDIKEANIPYGSGVQHCSCCSGRLETV